MIPKTACLEANVTRLVYTSTYNVVYGGQPIHNGDETLPYLSDDKFTDHYSKTKMLAEKKVMAANGQTTEDGSTLRCCALRLAGVAEMASYSWAQSAIKDRAAREV
nr:hypothetical protein BaRGS_023194 [Batillaria attramentaria]